jgi:hypothetical protein
MSLRMSPYCQIGLQKVQKQQLEPGGFEVFVLGVQFQTFYLEEDYCRFLVQPFVNILYSIVAGL